jgi:hypothetical protein
MRRPALAVALGEALTARGERAEDVRCVATRKRERTTPHGRYQEALSLLSRMAAGLGIGAAASASRGGFPLRFRCEHHDDDDEQQRVSSSGGRCERKAVAIAPRCVFQWAWLDSRFILAGKPLSRKP